MGKKVQKYVEFGVRNSRFLPLGEGYLGSD